MAVEFNEQRTRQIRTSQSGLENWLIRASGNTFSPTQARFALVLFALLCLIATGIITSYAISRQTEPLYIPDNEEPYPAN